MHHQPGTTNLTPFAQADGAHLAGFDQAVKHPALDAVAGKNVGGTQEFRFSALDVSPVTSKCTTCDHFKVHHLGWVFSDGLRGWLARS